MNWGSLATAWIELTNAIPVLNNIDGTAVTVEDYRQNETLQMQIKDYIVQTKDMRLFGLLQLLGYVSQHMENELWPEKSKELV